jgi:hypothetical protein
MDLKDTALDGCKDAFRNAIERLTINLGLAMLAANTDAKKKDAIETFKAGVTHNKEVFELAVREMSPLL